MGIEVPFPVKHAYFLASLTWLQQIYLFEFYLFSEFLCCTPNAVTTKCWKYAKSVFKSSLPVWLNKSYMQVYI